MNTKDLFFGKLRKLCNFNAKWINLLLADIYDIDNAEVLNFSMNRTTLVIETEKHKAIDELKEFNDTTRHPVKERILILLKDNSILYWKNSYTTCHYNKVIRVSKRTKMEISNDSQMNCYFNEHCNVTYLPHAKAKPANKIFDKEIKEQYKNGFILNSEVKDVTEIEDSNKFENNREYDITTTYFEPVPYIDPNGNTYISVTVNKNSLHNGQTSSDKSNVWYQNLDKTKKQFKCSEKSLKDDYIKAKIIESHGLKLRK